MSQGVFQRLMERLYSLPEEEKERLRKIPHLTDEEREKIRKMPCPRFVAGPPNPDHPGYGEKLEDWEKEALEHLSSGEQGQYILARLHVLGLLKRNR